MNKKTAAAALLTSILAAPAAAYTVDGQLADWGFQSNWSVASGVRGKAVENQSGSGAFYLDPGWGGQAYDAEALYVDWDASNLYVALVTGLAPSTPHQPSQNSYGAGDILFNFGGGAYEFGLVVKPYAGLQVGGAYRVAALEYGLWSSPGVQGPAPNPYPVAVRSGTLAGTGAVAYPGTSLTGLAGDRSGDRHYVIEASVPLSAFGGLWNAGAGGPAQELYVEWSAYCANDVIGVDIRRIPEPATVLLAGLGLAFLSGLGRRARRA